MNPNHPTLPTTTIIPSSHHHHHPHHHHHHTHHHHQQQLPIHSTHDQSPSTNPTTQQAATNLQAYKNSANPAYRGYIQSTHDALIVFQSCLNGVMPKVSRRLHERERRTICSGFVYVFDEQEAGIKRWTDGRIWSPSRILNNFLIYREIDQKRPTPGAAGSANANASPSSVSATSESPTGPQQSHSHPTLPQAHHSQPPQTQSHTPQPLSQGQHQQPPPRAELDTTVSEPTTPSSAQMNRDQERALVGSLTTTYKFKSDGLVKKTISISGMHMISYYKLEDVLQGRLRTPSSHPELIHLPIADQLLQPQHFRIAPVLAFGPDGRRYFQDEAEDLSASGTGGKDLLGASKSAHPLLPSISAQSLIPFHQPPPQGAGNAGSGPLLQRPSIDTPPGAPPPGSGPPGRISRPGSSAGSGGSQAAHSPVSPHAFPTLSRAPPGSAPTRRFDPYPRPARSPPTIGDGQNQHYYPLASPAATYEPFMSAEAQDRCSSAASVSHSTHHEGSNNGQSFDYRENNASQTNFRAPDPVFYPPRSLPSINSLPPPPPPSQQQQQQQQQQSQRLYNSYGTGSSGLLSAVRDFPSIDQSFGTYPSSTGFTGFSMQQQHQQQTSNGMVMSRRTDDRSRISSNRESLSASTWKTEEE